MAKKCGQVYEFHFRLEFDLRSYFHATLALLENFEKFDNFDHFIYNTFESFTTRESRYNPKNWAKNLNCKYKYLTNGTQLSRKQ